MDFFLFQILKRYLNQSCIDDCYHLYHPTAAFPKKQSIPPKQLTRVISRRINFFTRRGSHPRGGSSSEGNLVET